VRQDTTRVRGDKLACAENPRQARARFGVADEALDRARPEGTSARGEHLKRCSGLDRVAESSARAVHFERSHLLWSKAARGVHDEGNDGLLCGAVWRSEPARTPVLVRPAIGAPCGRCKICSRAAVANSNLPNARKAAFSAHIAICGRILRLASRVRSEHRSPEEPAESLGHQNAVGRADNRACPLAGTLRRVRHREVERHERR